MSYNFTVTVILNIILIFSIKYCYTISLNGYFTSKIKNYNLIVPYKVKHTGEFSSFHIPHFFKHDLTHSKKKRSLDDEDNINYRIKFTNENFHITLWPNHDFISPNAITEKRDPKRKIAERDVDKIDTEHMCHYIGEVRDIKNSRAAFSTCNGLAGFMTVGNKIYFIEPLEDHQPNDQGHHLHLIYDKNVQLKNDDSPCGVTSSWQSSWKENFREHASKRDMFKRDIGPKTDIDRYLELLVVCDKKFIDFHKRIHDIDTYILTIINMVSELFHDPSIGFNIDLQVVRIIYLEKEQDEFDLNITTDAKETLMSFCNWQMKINPKDISNPNHHDIAMLVTKQDICASACECGVMGLSYIGTPCMPEKSCSISEDNGLMLAFIMAHEIGHVMGCAHDDPNDSGCKPRSKDGSYYVMSPNVHIYTIRWSPCSKAFIEDLFENDLGECLLDKPERSLYQKRNILPGVVYDAQAQCEMMFPGSHVILHDEEKFCEELICRLNSTTGASTGESVVDGTKCGENKWCFRTKCVQAGTYPKATNGGWSNWGAPTPCSRTCGGGITKIERFCNNPPPSSGGYPCEGNSEKISMCNIQACRYGTLSYRDIQCAEANTKSSTSKWKAYLNFDQPCVLFCINQYSLVRKVQPRAKDGTPCKPGTKNICLSGVCTKVGCDYVIGSDAVEDICGVCDGQGTECKIPSCVFRDTGQDYEEVIVLPAGSRNILVEEMDKSPNIIALKDECTGEFLLNGNHKESPDLTFTVDGTAAVYRHPEPDREILAIKGPLNSSKILYVCFFNPVNVGYKYRYVKLLADPKKIGKYHWVVQEYGPCSAVCEGGIQEPVISCAEEKGGRVSPFYCKHLKKPKAPSKECNKQPCRTRWRVGKWGKCHACKFRSGIRSRRIECVKESRHPGGDDVLIDDDECHRPRPAIRELCNVIQCCRSRRETTYGVPNRQLRGIWGQIKDATGMNKEKKRKTKIKPRMAFNPIFSKSDRDEALKTVHPVIKKANNTKAASFLDPIFKNTDFFSNLKSKITDQDEIKSMKDLTDIYKNLESNIMENENVKSLQNVLEKSDVINKMSTMVSGNDKGNQIEDSQEVVTSKNRLNNIQSMIKNSAKYEPLGRIYSLAKDSDIYKNLESKLMDNDYIESIKNMLSDNEDISKISSLVTGSHIGEPLKAFKTMSTRTDPLKQINSVDMDTDKCLPLKDLYSVAKDNDMYKNLESKTQENDKVQSLNNVPIDTGAKISAMALGNDKENSLEGLQELSTGFDSLKQNKSVITDIEQSLPSKYESMIKDNDRLESINKSLPITDSYLMVNDTEQYKNAESKVTDNDKVESLNKVSEEEKFSPLEHSNSMVKDTDQYKNAESIERDNDEVNEDLESAKINCEPTQSNTKIECCNKNDREEENQPYMNQYSDRLREKYIKEVEDLSDEKNQEIKEDEKNIFHCQKNECDDDISLMNDKNSHLKDNEDMPIDKIIKVNVGDIVVDKKNTINPKLIEIPFKETSLDLNVPDKVFEELGDVLGDTLIKDQAKTLEGKELKSEMNKILRL